MSTQNINKTYTVSIPTIQYILYMSFQLNKSPLTLAQMKKSNDLHTKAMEHAHLALDAT